MNVDVKNAIINLVRNLPTYNTYIVEDEFLPDKYRETDNPKKFLGIIRKLQ